MKKFICLTVGCLLMVVCVVEAKKWKPVERRRSPIVQSNSYQHMYKPTAAIDAEGFEKLTDEAMPLRQNRLIPLDLFAWLAARDDVIVLDTRSKSRFDYKHVRGAIHLNFSDFSQEKLEKLIPNKETLILIYCNNNIDGDEVAFARKALSLALNIPTFINLYGYGYSNVYELGELVKADNPKLKFEGTYKEMQPAM